MNTDARNHLLAFPRSLPNDLEGFIYYYPAKFPPIVAYYQQVAEKITFDAAAFVEYGNWARQELGEAFEKIKGDYESGDQSSLEFLLAIDERFQKMYCYRFWVVNYLFPDGPIHDYFITNLKNHIRKIADVGESAEDFEQKIEALQRDLLQGEYADLYLQQALDGVKLYEQMQAHPEIAPYLHKAEHLIGENTKPAAGEVNVIWEELRQKITHNGRFADLKEGLAIPLEQSEMRGNHQAVYNMLTHTLEFKHDNHRLAERHRTMKSTIDQYRALAADKLTPAEYAEFELAYTQVQNFVRFKDIMGNIDPALLPLWFNLHAKIKDILLKRKVKMIKRPTGPPAVHQHFVWYLPDNLKARVMTPDFEIFELEKI